MKPWVVILAGGGGTRFWPASRRALPKQFLALDGDQTLLAQTVARAQRLTTTDRIRVVTGAAYADAVRAAAPDLGPHAVLVEPSAKNTAPAIAWAMARLEAQDADAVAAVLPADHRIGDPDGLVRALQSAARLAADHDRLFTLGIRPNRPATGYGYIEAGDPLEEGAAQVVRFVEKPDAAKAQEYLASGRYHWNSGMFVWKARVLLDELGQHEPELVQGLREAVSSAAAARFPRAWDAAPTISIDYAVLEKSSAVAVLPVDVGWDDLGAWDALTRNQAAHLVTVDADGNVVHAPDHTVALLGVSDLIVVEAGGAILVCPKDRAQDVREIVAALRDDGRDDLL